MFMSATVIAFRLSRGFPSFGTLSLTIHANQLALCMRSDIRWVKEHWDTLEWAER